jgi:hypothetical protein
MCGIVVVKIPIQNLKNFTKYSFHKFPLLADDQKIYRDLSSSEKSETLKSDKDSAQLLNGENFTEINIQKIKILSFM